MKSTENLLEKTLCDALFASRPTKAQRTKLRIVRAAIDLYATIGFHETTFERISKETSLSRPLVRHYFESRDDLLFTALKFIRLEFQQIAVAALRRVESPRAQLTRYVESTFEWVTSRQKNATVWLLFYSECALRPDWRDTNTEWVMMGHQRIAEILRRGNGDGLWKVKDVMAVAKGIQVQITGALVSVKTESLPVSLANFRKQTVARCLEMTEGE